MQMWNLFRDEGLNEVTWVCVWGGGGWGVSTDLWIHKYLDLWPFADSWSSCDVSERCRTDAWNWTHLMKVDLDLVYMIFSFYNHFCTACGQSNGNMLRSWDSLIHFLDMKKIYNLIHYLCFWSLVSTPPPLPPMLNVSFKLTVQPTNAHLMFLTSFELMTFDPIWLCVPVSWPWRALWPHCWVMCCLVWRNNKYSALF